jgi:hypothetical protein
VPLGKEKILNRKSGATVSLAAAALIGAVLPQPATAEAVTYQSRNVRAQLADGATAWAALDIPTGYDKQRLNRHAVGFFERVPGGRVIILDFEPQSDTLRELRHERTELAEQMSKSYEELAFHVNDKEAKVRARWAFAYTEGSGDRNEPYISVLLLRGGQQLQIGGRLSEAEHVRAIRQHVRKSVVFPS